MHEQSLVRALLQQVARLAAQHAAAHVKEVKVTVGEFSGVEPALLESAFHREIDGNDSLFRDARLTLRQTSLAAHCPACGQNFAVQRFELLCPTCGGCHVTITQGEELWLESVVLESVA